MVTLGAQQLEILQLLLDRCVVDRVNVRRAHGLLLPILVVDDELAALPTATALTTQEFDNLLALQVVPAPHVIPHVIRTGMTS